MPDITLPYVRRRVARLGYTLRKFRGEDRFYVINRDGYRHGGAMVWGGEQGDTLEGINDWVDWYETTGD